MSVVETIDTQMKNESPFSAVKIKSSVYRAFISPLWIILLLAIIVRVWLTIHTNGVLAGDEALVGIQAEHILRGEHPVYFYGQPYMGSLEAYFIALLFALAGPSVWMLRMTTTIVSLGLVILTWKFATALAEEAKLPSPAKKSFVIIAASVAALPPLYSTMTELRTWGGYIEAFVAMLWLLYTTFCLIQRWQAGATARELTLRWVGIGFLIGLGFWIDPLTIYADMAIALWISGYCAVEIVKSLRHQELQPRLNILTGLLLSVAALPGALIGSAPALYWGYHHQWENITYIIHNGDAVPQGRLHTIHQVANLYITCLVPHVIGGSLFTEPDVTYENPHLLTFGLVISAVCIGIAVISLLSIFWRNSLLVAIRHLTGMPLLFAACASIIYCVSSISVASLYGGCGFWDLTGRYIVPLVIVLPFFIAAIFTLPWMHKTENRDRPEEVGLEPGRLAQVTKRHWPTKVLQGGALTILFIYFCLQFYPYITSDPGYTFQTSGCKTMPANSDPVIAYMQREHLYYGWATGWIADPITFKTNGAITVTEPFGRVISNDNLVRVARQQSLLTVARQSDPHPPLLKALDAAHTTYRVASFPSEPGYNILVITPLNHPVSPFKPDPTNIFGILDQYGCG